MNWEMSCLRISTDDGKTREREFGSACLRISTEQPRQKKRKCGKFEVPENQHAQIYENEGNVTSVLENQHGWSKKVEEKTWKNTGIIKKGFRYTGGQNVRKEKCWKMEFSTK